MFIESIFKTTSTFYATLKKRRANKSQIFTFLLVLTFSHSALAQATMKIVYSDTFVPFSWTEGNTTKGILVDIMEEALNKRLNIPVSHNSYPWARANLLVQNGSADAYITVPTPARKEFAVISELPAASINFVMLTRSNHSDLSNLRKINTIEDLESFSLGVTRGNGWAKHKLKGLNVTENKTVEQMIRMLVLSRVDLIIEDKHHLNYRLKSVKEANELEFLPNTLSSVGLNLCVNKNSEFVSVVSKFDEVIKQMDADGTIDKIIKRYQ